VIGSDGAADADPHAQEARVVMPSDSGSSAVAPADHGRRSQLDELVITSETNSDGTVRLAVAGEIDMDTTAQFSDAVRTVLSFGPAQVIIDLGGVTFLGSSGLRALLTAQRVASEHDAALTVQNARGIVLQVLTISGLLMILDGHDPYS
jgi:anti-sigma B factor antagonist